MLPATVGAEARVRPTDETDAYVVVATATHRFASQAVPKPEMLAISWRTISIHVLTYGSICQQLKLPAKFWSKNVPYTIYTKVYKYI